MPQTPSTKVMQRPISYFSRQGGFDRDQDNLNTNFKRGNVEDPSFSLFPKPTMSGSEFIPFGHCNDYAMDTADVTPNADELASVSSYPNSLEASWNGSSYPYRSETHHGHHHYHHNRHFQHSQKTRSSSSNRHKLSHRHVMTPLSPSREHMPKRPRFAVDGLNVVETFIHSIISSCGCVTNTAVVAHHHHHYQHRQQRLQAHKQRETQLHQRLKPPFSTIHGFASKPLGFKDHQNDSNNINSNLVHPPNYHNYDSPYQGPNNGTKQYLSYPPPPTVNRVASFALPEPPKVRRLTMKDACKNDLDVTFLMH
jgi:hypothetical protein